MANGDRLTWVILPSLCCIPLILFLIAGTIVLALIPIYLSNKDLDRSAIQTGDGALSASYASNVADGRFLTLADTGSVSNQLVGNAGLSTTAVSMNQGNFAAASASARKKRQVFSGKITCERATGLTGDVFIAQYSIKYPALCFFSACRKQYLRKVQQSLRVNYAQVTVVMRFTNGETRTVRLTFCGFINTDTGDCTAETKKNAYLLDNNNTIYQFNPVSLAVTPIAPFNCSNNATLYSIAVQRTGIIWMLFDDGNISTYNIKTAQCRPTDFATNQSSFSLFSLTFLKSITDNSETLYVSKQNDPPGSLGVIDRNALTLSNVSAYNSNLSTYADLAGTSDGRLFGAFVDSPYTLARIDPSNAQILARYPLNATVEDGYGNYAFFAYQSLFYFFSGTTNLTNVFTYAPASNTTVNRTAIPQVIVGATASSCLGTA